MNTLPFQAEPGFLNVVLMPCLMGHTIQHNKIDLVNIINLYFNDS